MLRVYNERHLMDKALSEKISKVTVLKNLLDQCR